MVVEWVSEAGLCDSRLGKLIRVSKLAGRRRSYLLVVSSLHPLSISMVYLSLFTDTKSSSILP